MEYSKQPYYNTLIDDDVEEFMIIDGDEDEIDLFDDDITYTYQDSKRILDGMEISHIEKYLRDKKLQNINKK